MALLTGTAGCVGDDDDDADDADDTDDVDDTDDTDDVDDTDDTDDVDDVDDTDDVDDMDDVDDVDDTDAVDDVDDANDEDPDETVQFGEIVAFEASYIAEGRFTDPETGDTWQIRHEVDGENSIQRMTNETTGEEFGMYRIDGVLYLVMDEQCFINPSPDLVHDPHIVDDPDEHDEELESVGTDRIDGELMHVFEVVEDESVIRIFVSDETGHLRRVEFPEGEMDYRDWGTDLELEPPDMECAEFGEDDFSMDE